MCGAVMELAIGLVGVLSLTCLAGCKSQPIEEPIEERYTNMDDGCIFNQGRVGSNIVDLDDPIDRNRSSIVEVHARDDRGASLRVTAGFGDTKVGTTLGLIVYVERESKIAECEGRVILNGTPHAVRATWANDNQTWTTTGCWIDEKEVK